MTNERDIIGLAGVGLRPDGRVVFIASGNAFDDNIRALGAVARLQAILTELSNEPHRKPSDDFI